MRLTRITAIFLILLSFLALGGPARADEPAKVAIGPFKINAERDLAFLQEGIVDMLATRLSWEDKVTVIAQEKTERVAGSVVGKIDEKAAREIGTALGADYVLFGSLTIFGESVSIDARMIDVSGARAPVTAFTQSQGMDSVIPEVDAFAQDINMKVFGRGRPAAPEPPPVAKKEPGPNIYAHPEKLLTQGGEEPFVRDTETSGLNPDFIVAEGQQRSAAFWKSKNFEEDLKGLSLGDVDGDGNQETVFISSNKVFVYRNAERVFAKVAEVPGRADNNFLGVDVADVNGNGKAEIFVTNLLTKSNTLGSFVLEWQGDGFATVAEKERWYYRVIELPSRGKVLVGQKRGTVNPFLGPTQELVWVNGRYEPVDTLEIPGNLNVFGFVMGDVMNNGSEAIVAFNENDRLQILTKAGSREWKSSEHYGGSANYIELEPKRQGTDEGTSEDMGKARLYLPQRLFLKDLDRDGKEEVLVVKNYASTGRLFSRFRHFGSSEIASLSWDGLGLGLNWKTKKIEGYVSDYAVADFDNDSQDEIIAVVVISRGAPVFGKARSAIISYDLAVPEA